MIWDVALVLALHSSPPSRASPTQVRHPGTADTILHDFETMLWVASVASRMPALDSLRLEETLNQFASPLKEQVGGWAGARALESWRRGS